MARSNSVSAEQRDLVLEITRVFDAPPALVFHMWKEPEHMIRWHGPEGLALLACEIDFRVGGKWRRCMSKGPGHEHWIYGEYREIVEPSRLSFTYINDYDGFETLVTMDFVDEGGKTRMYFRQTPFISAEERDGHGWGWNSGFDLLAKYVAQFVDEDWRPKGRPRRDGVAEDIAAARARQNNSSADASDGAGPRGENR
jgi:uncharacterized protein YndB with AHSA1/START domain